MNPLARLRRLLLPGHDEAQELLVRTARQYAKHATEAQLRESALATQVADLSDAVSRLAGQAETSQKRLVQLHQAMHVQRDGFLRAWRTAGPALQYQTEQWRIAERLDRLRRSSRPVLVGPWTGEVGFELLYWIPFVTWAVAAGRLDRERLVVVSRGGTRLWYEHLTPHYIDALELFPAENYRQRTADVRKPGAWRPFDREVVRAVRARLGQSRLDLLHPLQMGRLFQPVWRQRVALTGLDEYTAYTRFQRPAPLPWQAELPDDYIAVKFYFSRQFPDTADNRRFAARVVGGLARHGDVVILGSGIKLDDHDDWQLPAQGRIHTLDRHLSPASNLDTQTRAIAGARAFVGSYGGFSYLAPCYGVPSLSFYADRDGFLPYHLEHAQRVFNRRGGAHFTALETRDAALVDSLLGEWGEGGAEPAART